MRQIKLVKLIALTLFTLFVLALLLTGRLNDRHAYARSTGPDPGFTHAPGEFDCRECHVPDGAPPGTVTIQAPQTYMPGQTYSITVNVSNSDPSRQRWGFQLTALDDTGSRAGTLVPSADLKTQVISGTLGNPPRQYVEHTST